MKQQKIAARALTLLLCLSVWGFIFSNSMQAAAQSSERSDAVLAMVNLLLGEFGVSGVSGRLIRKAAHFTEFSVLGGSLTLTLHVWLPRLGRDRRFALALLLGICSAGVDEAIQVFSDGRAARVADVVLDSAGVLAGALAVTGLLALDQRRRNRQNAPPQ